MHCENTKLKEFIASSLDIGNVTWPHVAPLVRHCSVKGLICGRHDLHDDGCTLNATAAIMDGRMHAVL